MWSLESSWLHWWCLTWGWLFCIAACCLHGIAIHWDPGLVNQGHGFDLGTDPVGPRILILSILSALVATPKLPRPCGCGKPPAVLPRGTRREVVRGEFALFNDAQYTVDLFSVSHCTGHLLGADRDCREDTLMLVLLASLSFRWFMYDRVGRSMWFRFKTQVIGAIGMSTMLLGIRGFLKEKQTKNPVDSSLLF